MTATATGTVDAMKRLFEGGYNSSGNFINKNDEYLDGSSENSSRTSGTSNETEIPREKSFLNGSFHSSPIPQSENSMSILSSSGGQISIRRNSVELPRTKPTPPKVKPKPVIYRKIVPNLTNEKILNPDITTINKAPKKILSEYKPINLSFENSEIVPRMSNSAMEIRPKPLISPTISDKGDENFHPKQEFRFTDALPPIPNSYHLPTAKKPPPVLKKPRSILSGHSGSNSKTPRTPYNYDKVLEEQFGMKVEESAYDFVESWTNYQAQTQMDILQNKMQRNGCKNGTNFIENGALEKFNRSPSVTSSTGMSGSNFTNSSIRSILKKGRPSLGVEKKRLTFKDDKELITKYNYPSENSYDETDSLEHFRSALGSDSDSSSSSIFGDDEAQDYELDGVRSVSTLRSLGSRSSGTKMSLAASNASSFSTSTLKGSIIQKPRFQTTISPARSNSLDRPHSGRNHANNNSNHNGSSGYMGPKIITPNKSPNTLASTPILLTPSKSDNSSKSHKITCRTPKL